MIKKILDNIKTLFIALIIALIIRSLLIQPFYIPSSSMEPTLLVGDRIFVSKFTYGYSNHSFPFSPSFLFKGRILSSEPKYGDLIVFKTPADNRTDFIKRLVGLPGDKIQFINGNLFVNERITKTNQIKNSFQVRCGKQKIDVFLINETLPNGFEHDVVYNKLGTLQNSDQYIVPDDHYFFLGDNRDCSRDSRFLSSVGYVHKNNLVGKAQLIFFSNDTQISSFLKFWNWKKSVRFNRFFKRLK
tara:strand:- start:21855 stop:22586 length:732 start_codon:yes stop_codon:yes gene_type:complete